MEVLDQRSIMSYINDALRKVQKEKESGYVAYESIVSAPGKELNRPQKWLPIIRLLTVLFFATGIIVLLYWLEYKKMPAKAPLKTAPLVSVIPAKPQPVNETPVENIREPVLKSKKAPPEIKVEPGKVNAKALYAQALKMQKEGNLNEARNLYRELLKIDSQNIQVLNNLGVIHMKNKYYKKAIMRFNDALNIKHDYTDAHYNLACLYAQRNDVPQSLFYLKNAIGFNPEAKNWAKNDSDLKVLANLPEFKKLLERQQN
jgi:tetratricopeptide (TPR) repeat protein